MHLYSASHAVPEHDNKLGEVTLGKVEQEGHYVQPEDGKGRKAKG